jgi:uncharacterized protein
MDWQGGRESDNVEDRENEGGYSGGGYGGGSFGGFRGTPGFPLFPLLFRGGMGSFVVVIIILIALGLDPRALLGPGGNGPGPGNAQPARHRRELPGDRHEGAQDPAHEELKRFVRVVLADTEDVWSATFREMGKTYRKPKLVLFRGHTRAGCGVADAATGPFYCPADETIYLDLAFFAEMRNRFHAPGEFAQAYVIAHEVGHHVQKLLGTMGKVDARRSQVSKSEANHLSVRLELQADFLAGYWANRANQMRPMIEAGDVDAAIRAANAIGDDTLQRESRGYAVPDSFTHGSSEQRIRWFRLGLDTGDLRRGDTFSAKQL